MNYRNLKNHILESKLKKVVLVRKRMKKMRSKYEWVKSNFISRLKELPKHSKYRRNVRRYIKMCNREIRKLDGKQNATE